MGNGEITAEMTQFDEVARRERFIVVYPNGVGRFEGRLLSWNVGYCCAYAFRNRTDDVRFLSALIDHLVAGGRADSRRIYLVGLSNGATLTHRAGAVLSRKVAAIGTVVGAMFGHEQTPDRPTSAIIIAGGEDRLVSNEGGALAPPEGRFMGRVDPGDIADRPFLPAESQYQFWARADGCAAPESSVLGDGTRFRAYRRCRDGAEVFYYLIANNGHAWPGGRAPRVQADAPTQAFSASEAIWDFLRRHPMPD